MRHAFHVWYAVAVVSVVTWAAVGVALGVLIGLVTGHVETGVVVGAVIGAVIGLLIGIKVAGGLQRDFETRPTPPPGGWRHWEDDDDWDN